ncbi:MAG: MFS transporter, partial [Candidatus Berkiella sp.]
VIRMLMGLGSSFGFVCLLISVYDWMPKKHYGFLIGLSQFIGLMGPMAAAGPLNSYVLSNHIDWRIVMFALGIAGVALTALVLFCVKDSQANSQKFRIISKKTPITKNLKQLLSQRQIWLIALYSALVYFTLEYLAENEGKVFIETVGYSSNFSSYMITMGWIGCAIGSPVLGSLSDLFKRRKLVMVFAAISCLLSFITIVHFPVSKGVLTVAFFMLGFGAAGQSIGFAIMAEQCSKAYLAIGLGFNNAMITLLMSINAPVVGGLLSFRNSTTSLTTSDYRFAFTFIIVLIALSVLLSVFFIKETYCRPSKGYTFINWMGFLKTNKAVTKTVSAN